MIVSLFSSALSNLPTIREVTWEEFTALLGPHEFRDTPVDDKFSKEIKKQLPAFCPCEFKPGKPRAIRNALRVHFGVIDLDDVPISVIVRILEATQGLARVFYTSWKQEQAISQGLYRARLIIQFSRPIESADWKIYWPALLARLQAPADPQCKDVTRLYFGAFAPRGTEHCAEYQVFPGLPLDVDSLSITPADIPTPQRITKVPRERLESIAKTWKRSKDSYRANMGEILSKVVKGESFAEPGERDTTIFQLTRDLVKELPHAEPGSLADHFAQSLQLMGVDGEYISEEVQAKLERAQETIAIEEQAIQVEEISDRKLRIREAFNGTRDYPYSESELTGFAFTLGCTREELAKRWIIQRGQQYYILVDGKYSPAYGSPDVATAALRDLAPACSAGVTLFHEHNGQIARKDANALMADYGSVATSAIIDLRAQLSSYDAVNKIFTEAPCPIRPILPRFNPDIDRWLQIMCGVAYWDVLSWISIITDLDSICVALMFTGPPGTGKTLLAMGLARLWSTYQPTRLESALHGFNASLAGCPLIFGDEQLPKDWKGNGRTAEIRQLIADRVRSYNKKYSHETSIIGAIRLIIAANNEEILAISDNLSTNDIEAIGDRFYHIRTDPDAAGFLRSVVTDDWVNGDAIAAHALWLKNNLVFERNGRFQIKSLDREFYRSLTTRTGIRSSLLQWLIGYLKNPRPVDTRNQRLIRIKDGKLLVNVQSVIGDWDTYVKNEPCPPTGQLSRALSGISTARVHLRFGNVSTQYRVIDTEHLTGWSKETEFASTEEITEALAVDSDSRALTTRNPAANEGKEKVIHLDKYR